MRYLRVGQPWMHWDEVALRHHAGVYVHIPFCLSRCGYCDFLTYGRERPAGLEPDVYTDVLMDEIARRGAWAKARFAMRGRCFDSVFFGGGTPTFLPPALLVRLIRAVYEHFPLADVAEVTVEANPDTLDPVYIDTLAAAGVNRLSVGIQATQPRLLRLLGRTHRWDNIQPAIHALRTSRIQRYSFDVIYSLPGLTQHQLRETLTRLLALNPEHISAYELTLEPGTPLHSCALHLPRLKPREHATVRQQRLIERILARAGFYRYEVSNYARPGAECRHNLRYWRGGDYVGLGLGAASRIGTRVVNNPGGWHEYLRVVGEAGRAKDVLAQAWSELPEAWREHAPQADTFLQVRTRLGCPVDKVANVQPAWLTAKWIEPRTGGWSLTSRGLNFAERIALTLD